MTKENKPMILPDWGPYSKKYMGISHVISAESAPGARFDCVVHPTIANSSVPVPNVTFPSNYHPWNFNPDFSFYEYRYDLEWKDRVYADVAFLRLNEHANLIRVNFVNRTDLSQNCLLNFFCSIEYPSPLHCTAAFPQHCTAWDAVDYTAYTYAKPRPWDEQNPDGLKKGEIRNALFTNDRGLGYAIDESCIPAQHFLPFGAEAGDSVSYSISVPQDYSNAVLGIRYRGNASTSVWNCEGLFTGTLSLSAAQKDFSFATVRLGAVRKGTLPLTLTALGTAGVELDCLWLVEEAEQEQVHFQTEKHRWKPEVGQENNTTYFSYADVPTRYGIRLFSQKVRWREIESGCLEDALISRLSNPDPTFDDVLDPFSRSFSRKHSDDGFFVNALVHSIFIPPQSSQCEYAIVFDTDCPEVPLDQCETLYQQAKAAVPPIALTNQGKPFAFSNRLLRSTLLSNIVYPVYKHGENVKHFTPGKRWDSFYTWDSGFIGLGLLEAEPKLAEYIMEMYLSDDTNPDYAFLFHGSPVPVQIYLYLELLNRSNDKTLLLRYYPRFRLYYEFLVGKTHSSTTGRFQSGLTTTYDLFYSSSGMDDYPAQMYLHDHHLEWSAAPAITASHAIRFGKILSMAAEHLGKAEDVQEYREDMQKMTAALQTYSWDEDSGYFSYVLHDRSGMPTGILRNAQGENLNKGFDGVYPIVAGACTPEQAVRVLEHLKSPENLCSPVGLSAVDLSSSYFTDNGYWNGSVWFSHQWFFFKAMLDLGETDFAFQIANTALNAWKQEVDASYNCFEMMNIATKRGGWYHQFGGLSATLNVWANAYYKPGTVTAGLDVWIEQQTFPSDYANCEVRFQHYGEEKTYSLVVVLNDARKKEYQATLNGQPVALRERLPGLLEVTVRDGTQNGRLIIR